jgi:hypothetical protein
MSGRGKAKTSGPGSGVKAQQQNHKSPKSLPGHSQARQLSQPQSKKSPSWWESGEDLPEPDVSEIEAQIQALCNDEQPGADLNQVRARSEL